MTTSNILYLSVGHSSKRFSRESKKTQRCVSSRFRVCDVFAKAESSDKEEGFFFIFVYFFSESEDDCGPRGLTSEGAAEHMLLMMMSSQSCTKRNKYAVDAYLHRDLGFHTCTSLLS